MPARLSVVVPIAASAGHLDSCLRSLGDQSIDALDVVIVDDGAAANSLDVARGWAARDPRFRVVARTGDASARDAGVAAARSEFLGFVNAEDVVPRRGYELLLRKLESSGSDFATGNVRRLVGRSVVPEPSVARAFARSRSRVRLADVRPLIADQLITNKLWRRSFWDEHSFRLPDGDDPSADVAIVLRAHLLAGSVDVVRHSVYLRRVPNGNDLAATTGLTDIEQFRLRFAGIEAVRQMLGSLGPRKVVRWYDANVVRQDLPPYLNVLDIADDEYARELVDTLRGYRSQLRASAFESLPTIDRLIWHLIGRGLVDQVVETVEFAKQGQGRTQAVRRGDRWYDDLPFRTDPALAIPADVYELDHQLMPVVTVEELGWTGHRLFIRGHAHIRHLGAPLPASQRIRIYATAVTKRRVRVPLRVRQAHRPDVTAGTSGLANLDWSGFSAVLSGRLLRVGRLIGITRWQLTLSVATQGVERTAGKWLAAATLDRWVGDRRLAGLRVMRARLSTKGDLTVGIEAEPPTVTSLDVSDGGLVLAANPGGVVDPRRLRLVTGTRTHAYPVRSGAGGISVVAPLVHLAAGAETVEGPGPVEIGDGSIDWSVRVQDGSGADHVLIAALRDQAPTWSLPRGRELVAYRSHTGALRLVERSARPVIEQISWSGDGELVLAGRFPAEAASRRAVLRGRGGDEEHGIDIDVDRDGARFTLRFFPAHLPGRFGSFPLVPGTWEFFLEGLGSHPRVRFAADPGVVPAPAVGRTDGGGTFSLRRSGPLALVLVAHGDRAERERGAANQHRLRTVRYPSASLAPLRDAVTYLSFNGRQFSDNPRAIYQELVSGDLDLEQLWVVRQDRCQVSGPATVLREFSEEYYDAMATSRLIVTNDYLPPWFVTRPGQVVLQTWHGHPLKLIGQDRPAVRKVSVNAAVRQAQSWTHVLSPSPAATPMLASAFGVAGKLLETGYPRTDMLVGAELSARSAAVRERIGVPAGKRVVLYMPTYRDQLAQGQARYALNQDLDLDLLRRELSDDHVVLFRKHHYVVGASMTEPDEFVIDVSGYPDATELMLAADVLMTDYSSAMFDWMRTGRPIVYFVPDLEYYRDELRGFYFDLEAVGPGQFVRTNNEVVDALRSADELAPSYAERYQRFRSTYCSLDDGGASARVVDVLQDLLAGRSVDLAVTS